eukprot:6188351-Pleurochrysis_carterae.AAC.2
MQTRACACTKTHSLAKNTTLLHHTSASATANHRRSTLSRETSKQSQPSPVQPRVSAAGQRAYSRG